MYTAWEADLMVPVKNALHAIVGGEQAVYSRSRGTSCSLSTIED